MRYLEAFMEIENKKCQNIFFVFGNLVFNVGEGDMRTKE